MRKVALFVALVSLTFIAQSRAAIIFTGGTGGTPTVGLPGFRTYNLTATTDVGQIQGFDFASQAAYGFFGVMNQVNPFGLPTVFNDNNAAIPAVGGDASQDSQFTFKSSDLTIPAGFASESGSQLRAVFAASAPLGTSVPFAQIVIPEDAAGYVTFTGQIQIANGAAITDNLVSGFVTFLFPEPSGILLLSLAGLGLINFRGPRKKSSLKCDYSRSRGARVLKPITSLLTLGVLGVATPSHAAVIIQYTGAPTVGLAGYTTYTLTATTDTGSIQGFDFASLPIYGFFGSMNQVNPFTLPTIFTDNNATFPAVSADVSADSQFKFQSGSLTIPAGFASESTSQLRAVFAASSPLGASVPFVQLAISNATGFFNFAGQIQVVNGASVTNVDVSGASCLGCAPPDIIDATIPSVNANSPGFVEHIVQVFGGLGSVLGNFAFDSYTPAFGGSGVGPATPATLDLSTRKFNWNTIGSPLGIYKWTFNATNNYGSDTGSITVAVTVPEPTSAGLLLIFSSLIFAARRRRHHEWV